MPYDSFLLDPLLLFLTGLGVSWLLARQPVRVRPAVMQGTVVVTLIVYWGTSVSLYFDLAWTRWLWEMCGAETGRDWMLNSGIFHFDYRHPGWPTHLISLLIFTTYPFWLLAGLALGWPRLRQGEALGPARWCGQKLRQEVWYGTATDAQSGDGLWLHAETVAPPDAAPYVHGWAAFFPVDAAPVLSRFGPEPVVPGAAWVAGGGTALTASSWQGETPRIHWNLQQNLRTPPLLPFARWLWEMEALPGAMVVLDPRAAWQGALVVDGAPRPFAGSAGLARIYGHGSAERWAWLHADLGDGAVLEVVAAVSTRPGLNRLRPLPFVQLRWQGEDWPRFPSLAALGAFHCTPQLPGWTLSGQVGRRRLHVAVALPPELCVVVDYRDPDGRAAVCTNSARADVTVRLEERRGGAWQIVKNWQVLATGHAEVGLRPGPSLAAPAKNP